MDVTDESVYVTGRSVQMMTGLALFGFDINTQNPAFVLFVDQSRVDIQKLPFDHAPLDWVGTVGVQVTDILAFDFFHRPE